MNDYRLEVRLAGAALRAALAGKWKTAERLLKRISDECGGEGMNTALMGWCDTFADHATDGAAVRSGRVNLEFMQTSTGQLDKAGSTRVPARILWAGRLIKARAEMDQAAWSAALDDLPEDPLEMSRHIVAVLEGVATTINGLPRGYARMGRAS